VLTSQSSRRPPASVSRQRRPHSSGCCNWPQMCSSSLGRDLSLTCGRTWPPKASRSMTRRCANWTPLHHGQTIRLVRCQAMTTGRGEVQELAAVSTAGTKAAVAAAVPGGAKIWRSHRPRLRESRRRDRGWAR
jgi:hypothetical protein